VMNLKDESLNQISPQQVAEKVRNEFRKHDESRFVKSIINIRAFEFGDFTLDQLDDIEFYELIKEVKKLLNNGKWRLDLREVKYGEYHIFPYQG
jgi:hypothetical protein